MTKPQMNKRRRGGSERSNLRNQDVQLEGRKGGQATLAGTRHRQLAGGGGKGSTGGCIGSRLIHR